jgi:hypothetical protein
MQHRIYLRCQTEQDMKLAMEGLFHAQIQVIGFLHNRHYGSANNQFTSLFTLYNLWHSWAAGFGIGLLGAGGLAWMLSMLGIPAVHGWDVVGLICTLLIFFTCWFVGFVGINRTEFDLKCTEQVLSQQAYVLILAPCDIKRVRQVCRPYPEIGILNANE